MKINFLRSINDISAAHWDALFANNSPFTQHAFLLALESSGCTQASTGWQSQHIIVSQNDQPIAAMPCFIKTHSYGEYVFDWTWADAYHQHGYQYYPKLLFAIPFTPSTGHRLGFCDSIKTQQQKSNIITFIDQATRKHSHALSLSSCHLLFPPSTLSNSLNEHGWKQRTGIQYHWFNQQYHCFDDFLNKLKSRKRKNINKERLAISTQDIRMATYTGHNISEQLMNSFYRFYQKTYLKRSGQAGYLNTAFFQSLRTNMPDNLVMFCAIKDEQVIAAALCFKDSNTLYGRYWGCEQEYEFLHFETCYYQGIDYCIMNKLTHFDPGAQGEHKISRGFEPIQTFSNHVILNPNFSQAIASFINEEKKQIDAHMIHLQTLSPFKLEQG